MAPVSSRFMFLVLLATLALADIVIAADPATKPNILFILSDDHSCQSIGAYRTWLAGFIHEQDLTPNIDRLSDQGAIFDRSFPSTPRVLPKCGCSSMPG